MMTSPIGPVLMGISYLCCASFILRLTNGVDGLATIWLPSGILLAALLIVPAERTWQYVAAALIASWAANFAASENAVTAMGFTLANLIEAGIAALIIGRGNRARVAFANPRGLGVFVGATFLAAIASAAIGYATFPVADYHFPVSWFATVWLGMLLITPVIMVTYEAVTAMRKLLIPIRPLVLSEIFLLSVLTSSLTFFQTSLPILFLPLIVAGGAVLAAGALGGIIAIGTTAAIGSWALAIGLGPVVLIDTTQDLRVLFFQAYLVILFISALPLARLLAIREQMRIDLAERIRLLDQAEKAANIGHWRVNSAEGTLYWSPEVFRIHGRDPANPPALIDAIQLHHPDDQARIAGVVRVAVTDGIPFEFSGRIVRADGSVRHVISKGERDLSSIDGAHGLFGIIQDVTEQVETQQRLAEARDAAEKAAQVAMQLADTDALTALANRRAIMRSLSRSISATADSNGDLAVIMFDVDHFKAVNDRYGHDAGDSVLKCVADTAAANVRTGDLLGRYGGEEFLVILPDTPAATATAIAERVRTAVAKVNCPSGLPVTISLGVASLRPTETVQSLLKRADDALYAAKDGGRNRLTLAA